MFGLYKGWLGKIGGLAVIVFGLSTVGATSTPIYAIAVLPGLIFFLSPRILPQVPAYVCYLSGHEFGTRQGISSPLLEAETN